jgi:hypothetical protein
MTYLGPDGKQYVAVLAGVGGIGGVFAKSPKAPPTGGVLWVFGTGSANASQVADGGKRGG